MNELAKKNQHLICVDIGSNSVRALVAKIFGDESFNGQDYIKESLRLESQMDSDGNLTLDAQIALCKFLERVKTLAQKYQAPIRVCATHALREAKNSQDVCRFVYLRTGLNLEIISGKEEARLVFLGVNYHSPCSTPTLVLDIGGGSTEIYIGSELKEIFSTSLKLGAVRLTKHFIHGSATFKKDIEVLKLYIESRLEPLQKEMEESGFQAAYGTSGTIKSVKQIATALQKKMNLPPSRPNSITSAEIDMVFDALLALSPQDDKTFGGAIDLKRSEIIIAGTAILKLFTKAAKIQEWQISLSGLREGMVLDSLNRESRWKKGNLSDVRFKSVIGLCQKYQVDELYAWHVMRLSLQLFDELAPLFNCEASYKEFLRAAALLHETGKLVSLQGYHKHSEYLVSHSNISGFNYTEIAYIATIIRLHRKKVPPRNPMHFYSLTENTQEILLKLSSILRLCVSLDRMHSSKVKKIKLQKDKDSKYSLLLFTENVELTDTDLFDLRKEKTMLEVAFDITIKIDVIFSGLN